MTNENGTQSCQTKANTDSKTGSINDSTGMCSARAPVYGANPDEILIENFIIGEQGLHIDADTLLQFNLSPGTPVSMVLSKEQVLISADNYILDMLNAAQELQLRQDEQKLNYSSGIRALVSDAFQALGIPVKKTSGYR